MRHADVAIIGAGPAGSACAIGLLQRRPDINIMLIDRDVLPRAKACGDLISPRAQSIIAELGVEAHNPWAPTSHTMASPSGAEWTHAGPKTSSWLSTWIMERREFDSILLDRARTLGVTVVQGAHVTRAAVSPNGWTLHFRPRDTGSVRPPDISTRVLVGADGSSSTVARLIGCQPNPAHAVALRGYATITQEGAPWSGTRMDFLPELLPFYGWAFSADATGRTNVGVARTVAHARKNQAGMHAALDSYLRHLQDLGFGVSDLTGVVGATLPNCRPDVVTAHRAALIGDAAGLVNPLDGEGISMALASGIMLSSCIADADLRQDADVMVHLDAYAAWTLQQLYPRLKRASTATTWFTNPVLADQILSNPEFTDYARLAAGYLTPLRRLISG